MKKKNVEEKLADLIHAFKEKKELSVKDITDLLSCNRQSVYNYIDRLMDRGFAIDRRTKDRSVYFTLTWNDGSAVTENYTSLTDNILRKYMIVQQLHKAAASPKNLEDLFLLAPDELEPTYNPTKIPLDIASSTFKVLLNELDEEDEIRLDANGIYHATGRTIPILHHFTDEELFTLLDQLKTLPEGSPYHSQLRSIAKKLEILEASYDMGDVSSSNYVTYGKNHGILNQISLWMEKLSKTNYREKLLWIDYLPRTEKQPKKVLFQIGMVIYSVEKAALYLFGKVFTEDPVLTPVSDSIIDLSTVTDFEETKYPNNNYHSAAFQKIFSEMFSISVEEPVKVTVRFDLTANVKRKVQYLKQQRSGASIDFLPDENQLEYTDTIRGLNDFANYLRQFGKSVHVIAPAELKEKMEFSVDRTLSRYEEADHE